MTIAKQLKDYLDAQDVSYDLVTHPRTMTSSETAQAAHIAGDLVAKSVLIHHEEGHFLAVVPSTHRIDLGTLQALAGTRLGLAAEKEVGEIFNDCDLGAVPPIGAAYGIEVMIDRSLDAAPEVFFEGGDHRTLVHTDNAAFRAMTKGARREVFSHHV